MDPETSRREFLTTSITAGAVVAMLSDLSPLSAQSASKDSEQHGSRSPSSLHIKPRYYRWHVDPGVEWVETNTAHAALDWTIPLSQAAIVLVDVWDHHYLLDTEARAEAIIDDKLVPLLTACRAAGLPIIHAPSPAQARPHPNWVNLVGETEVTPKREDWPPAEFRSKSGQYQPYGRPNEPRQPELNKLGAERKLHPKVQPLAGEPVIATGEELHRYCKRHGILFLFFAGFNTNACILVRDYGTLAMNQRGYEVIVVRDCTTGMESSETQSALSQTRGAILFLEMFGNTSVTSDEIIAGLPQA
ncbi:cysteine hydrolase family protein [Singulisphaera acidiphila]|uniref:Nicotinamidase-like amidase n=1 Tax=Singulisphaera acidiphila (strain ATCC BAA-1392 / DSM 18658 / VKM B-2454 / MOB10) TaxID=886293 RepID=L0DQM2_SINAD|nr:isochorismatase family protein [Singulisphaera acidiphila]AGA31258.1 nicotinamidase-like amidase [Singulisphaera acidiphila DSM 18658]